MMNRMRKIVAAALLVPLLAGGADAHHGWRWAEAENSMLEGTIVSVRLGNPHGLATVEAADGEIWQVELGQPWRNQGAGLTDDLLQPGVAISIEGHRSANPDERVIKAERISIGGMRYNLYPDRD